jgi:hypothetical protein
MNISSLQSACRIARKDPLQSYAGWNSQETFARRPPGCLILVARLSAVPNSYNREHVLLSALRAIGLASHIETEMLSPLLYIALVAHANFLRNMDGGPILRRDQRDYARES